jgi:trigger factor
LREFFFRKFIVKEIKRVEPAEVNQELFDKLFGEGEVENEEAFRKRIAEDLKNGLASDSDRLFKRDVMDKLIKDYNPSLPDSFLKKWIPMSNEQELTPEQVEQDYDKYQKSVQWQLIFDNLVKSEEIKLSQEDLLNQTKELLAQQYIQYGMPEPEDEDLQKSAMQVLQDKEQAQRVQEMVSDEKLLEYVRSNGTIKEKEVDYDKFVEMAEKG